MIEKKEIKSKINDIKKIETQIDKSLNLIAQFLAIRPTSGTFKLKMDKEVTVRIDRNAKKILNDLTTLNDRLKVTRKNLGDKLKWFEHKAYKKKVKEKYGVTI